MRVAIGNLALAVAVVGCGAAGESSSATTTTTPEPPRITRVTESGSTEVSATVGVPGGTLSLANGARLEIPAGALAEPTEVSFGAGVDGRAFGDAETQRPLGPMMNVDPAMRSQANEGLTVSIPRQSIPNGFEEADLAFAMEEVSTQRAMDVVGTQTRWQLYPVRVEDDRFVATVDGLAGQRLRFGVAR